MLFSVFRGPVFLDSRRICLGSRQNSPVVDLGVTLFTELLAPLRLKTGGHWCPFWLIWFKNRGPWLTWWFNQLPGPSVSKRTPMPAGSGENPGRPRMDGCGYGSKLNSYPYRGFSLWFHLPRCHFGTLFLATATCLKQMGGP